MEFFLNQSDDSVWGTDTSLDYTFANFRVSPALPNTDIKPPVYPSLTLHSMDFSQGWIPYGGGCTVALAADGQSVGFTFTKGADQWTGATYTFPSPVDLSQGLKLDFDLNPTAVAPSGSDFLGVNIITADGQTVYGGFLPRFTAGSWNTFAIPMDSRYQAVQSIQFFVDASRAWPDGITSITYDIGNIRLEEPTDPVITASSPTGQIIRGTPVTLTTSVPGGMITYTTDGANPATSASALPYTGPIAVNDDTVLTACVSDGVNVSYPHIFVYTATGAITMSFSSAYTGNIFPADAANNDVTVNFTNALASGFTFDLTYKVTDSLGFTVGSGTLSGQSVAGGGSYSGVLPLQLNAYGVFDLAVTVASTGGDIFVNETGTTGVCRVIPVTAGRQDSAFGMCTHMSSLSDAETLPPLVALSGNSYVRDGIAWSVVEQSPGVYAIPASWLDYLQTLNQNGIQPIIILAFGNTLYMNATTDIPATQAQRDAYVNYVKYVTSQLKGRVAAYEIWNEPNQKGSWFNSNSVSATDYTEMLREAYTAIKGTDPTVTVLGGSLAELDEGWLTEMMQNGAYDCMDALSFHPYNCPASPEAGIVKDLSRCAADMEAADPSHRPAKPIWLTEMGWPTNLPGKDSRGVSELTQADYLVRMNVLGLSTGLMAKCMWYDLQDTGVDIYDGEQMFGVIRSGSAAVSPWGAKAAFAANAVLGNQLLKADFVSGACPDGKLYLEKFRRPGDGADVLVAWNITGSRTVTLDVGSGMFTVTDLFGNSYTAAAVNGSLTVALSESPVYIDGTITGDTLPATAALFAPSPAAVSVANGSAATLQIARSGDALGLTGEYQLLLPDGWSLSGSAIFSGGTLLDTLQVTVPAAASGSYPVTAYALSGGAVVGQISFTVTVTSDPVQLVMVPAYRQGQWFVDVTVTNVDPGEMSGSLSLTAPIVSDAYVFDLPVNGSQIFSIPADELDGQVCDVTVTVTTGAKTASFTRHTGFLRSEKTSAPITLDGVLSPGEWDSGQAVSINNPAQPHTVPNWDPQTFNGTVRTMWDKQNFYLAVTVVDQVQHQVWSGVDIWRGDSLQFGFDNDRMAGGYAYSEMGVALGADGKTVQKWVWSGSTDPAAIDCAITRDEDTKTTTYEIAIPWSQILQPGETPNSNDDYGFSLVINNNDDPADTTGASRTWLGLTTGIADTKSSKMFSDLLLTGPVTAPAFTATFEANGGSAVPAQTVDADGKISEPAAPTREGYTFLGWYKDAALTEPWDFAGDSVTSDVTLYAGWTKVPEIATIEITSVTPGNGQADVNFAIHSANGRGYMVYISATGQAGSFQAYDDVNYNAKGAHLKGLSNGKTYYVYIEYSDGMGMVETSGVIEVTAMK